MSENYGSHCDECGAALPQKASTILEIKGMSYTLCEDCYKQFVGAQYLAKPQVFEELIKVLSKQDRNRILKIING